MLDNFVFLSNVFGLLGMVFNLIRYFAPFNFLRYYRDVVEKERSIVGGSEEKEKVVMKRQESVWRRIWVTILDIFSDSDYNQNESVVVGEERRFKRRNNNSDNNDDDGGGDYNGASSPHDNIDSNNKKNKTLPLTPYEATQQISGMPYLCQHITSLFWLNYGYMKSLAPVFYINLFGVTISTYYLTLFYSITERKRTFVNRLLCAEFIFISSFLFMQYQIQYNSDMIDLDAAYRWWGFIASVCTIVNFASPLATLKTVLKTRNSESIPLILSVANLCGSLTWTLYGLFRREAVIIIPNSIGTMLSILNVTVKYVY